MVLDVWGFALLIMIIKEKCSFDKELIYRLLEYMP